MLFRVPVVQIHNTLLWLFLTWAKQELKGFVSFHPEADSVITSLPFVLFTSFFIFSFEFFPFFFNFLNPFLDMIEIFSFVVTFYGSS